MKVRLSVSEGEKSRGVKRPAVKRGPGFSRRLPVGAELAPGGAHFRVWAPKAPSVTLECFDPIDFAAARARSVELEPEGQGYFSGFVPGIGAGTCYKFRLGGGSFPDPASRFQPQGPHGPSQVIDPGRFLWANPGWRGLSRRGQVIYEMHIGTFTAEGTWAAAGAQLAELAALGITTLELMPVAEFSGRFGWGYDGVALFAPTRLYGTPDEFRAFVDAAHGQGLGVILDVVYNHLGPDGNYLRHFSDDYFSDRYACEWGEAINFDGRHNGPVREFFASNAAYWIEEFHLDGLRLDATQQIFDSSEDHILRVIARKARGAAQGRGLLLVAENEPQQTRLVRPLEEGGCNLDALWNDDFHHSAHVALTGHREAYFGDYRGTPQEFISAMKHGYVYQGQWSAWQKQRRGTPARGLEPAQFINFIQNHDQIANSLRGVRLHQATSPGRLRAMTALLLLGPGTPMLFQGQEFAASAPFLFFADHPPELAQLVAKGRRKFLNQFPSIAALEASAMPPGRGLFEPSAEETFLRCKLNFSERLAHGEIYALHRDLLKLRRDDPVFSQPDQGTVDGAVLGRQALALRFFGDASGDRLLLVNFGPDLSLSPAPEPLLAPMADCDWGLLWSSEDPRYGGGGTGGLHTDETWRILGEAAAVLGPIRR